VEVWECGRVGVWAWQSHLHKVACSGICSVFALPACYTQLKITIEMYMMLLVLLLFLS